MTESDQTEWTLTVDEAAKLLRVARNSCYEAVKRGEIPSIRIGKRILIPRVPFETMLAKGQGNAKISGNQNVNE